MAFKFLTFCAFVTVARAGLLQTAPISYAGPVAPVQYAATPIQYAAAPVAYASAPVAYASPAKLAVAAPLTKVAAADEYDPNPQYSYSYDIQDSLTGDSKSQHETRNGDVVQGSYSLIDADGTRRTVDYTADSHNGFNAVVHKEPLGVKVGGPAVVAAKVAAPLSYAGPAYNGQVAYSAPVAKVATYAAPAYAYHH